MFRQRKQTLVLSFHPHDKDTALEHLQVDVDVDDEGLGGEGVAVDDEDDAGAEANANVEQDPSETEPPPPRFTLFVTPPSSANDDGIEPKPDIAHLYEKRIVYQGPDESQYQVFKEQQQP